MGNLGWYQVFTKVAKKVGGPLQLAGIFIAGGAALGAAGKTLLDHVKKKREETKNSKIYVFKNDITTNEGLELKSGTEFRVLERDKDAVLVDISGIENNPYFISYELLKTNSDYI